MPEEGPAGRAATGGPEHPDEWQRDLDPNYLRQNIGETAEARIESDATAFHLRKGGWALTGAG